MTNESNTNPPAEDSTEEVIGDAAGLLAANAELAEENRRLNGLVQADPAFFKLYAEGLATDHWAAKLLAYGFSEEFEKSGVKNCIMVTVPRPDGLPPIAVTLQVVGGKTPHERIAELEEEVADLRRQLAARETSGGAAG